MTATMTTRLANLENASSITPQARPAASGFSISLATTAGEVRESQRLRYQVFAEEMGARLNSAGAGLDVDQFDAHCQHVIVRDQATREVVASTRVLLDADARLAGGFYSESEFDISGLLKARGGVMEIGRTCVHRDYRSGTAISLLWSGLARCIDLRRYRYLIGCASMPMADGGASAMAAYMMLKQKYLVAEELRVTPRLPLHAPATVAVQPSLPPLLKAYIRLGARIGGAPCHDPLFDCADLFIVLSPADLQRRYARHFIER